MMSATFVTFSKETSTPFSDHYLQYQTDNQVVIASMIKKNNGRCFGFVQTSYCQSCLSIKFKFRVNYAPTMKVNSDVQNFSKQ